MTASKHFRLSALVTRWPGSTLLPAIAYCVVLHWAYANRVSPLFSYLGYRYRTPTWPLYLVAVCVVLTLAVMMPRRLSRTSDFMLWVLFLLSTAPSILLPAYSDIIAPWKAFTFGMVVGACWVLVLVALRMLPQPRLNTPRLPRGVSTAALVAFSLGVYLLMFRYTGIGLRIVALAEVTQLRLRYREALAASGSWLAYLILLQGNIVNPLFMARGVRRRGLGWLAFGVAGQLVIFSATGYKTILLSVPVVLALALLFHFKARPQGAMLPIVVVVVGVLSLVGDSLLGTRTLTLVFVNRLLITPGVLAAAHVSVFDQLGQLHWSYSFMSRWLDYPLSLPPAFVVGEMFSNSPETSANGNLFADGYMNLGYLGMLIEAAVLVLLLWLVNISTRGRSIALTSIVFVTPTLVLANTSVFTAFLTHGFLAACVMFLLAPQGDWPASSKTRGRHRADPFLTRRRAGRSPSR